MKVGAVVAVVAGEQSSLIIQNWGPGGRLPGPEVPIANSAALDYFFPCPGLSFLICAKATMTPDHLSDYCEERVDKMSCKMLGTVPGAEWALAWGGHHHQPQHWHLLFHLTFKVPALMS